MGASDTPRWQQSVAEVAADLCTDPDQGLGADEALRRLRVDGPNELVEEPPPSAWQILARQFTNTMTAVLAAAALVTLVVGDRKDTAVILVVVVLDATIGFVQERRAEQAMTALRHMTAATARVVRGGQVQVVPTASIVVGDVVVLATGDVVPADLRLVGAEALRITEAALTGEAEPTAKTTMELPRVAGSSMVGDRLNLAFKGTAVSYGRGRGVVVATGMATELGRIAALLQGHPAGATPLQRSLAVLGRRLAAAALVVCALVFLGGVSAGEPTRDMFLVAVSLAVAAIPEGLPAVVTISLALGARRMADQRAVVRSLPAVETLGSVTVICTDKTGTLTENRMMVERVWTPSGTHLVTGDGYRPTGAVDGHASDVDPPGPDSHLARLARVAAACNDATLHAPLDPDGEWAITGDPTEGALLVLAAKLGVEHNALDRSRPRTAEVAFDATRRRMTTVHRAPGGLWVAVKGALDALVPLLAADEDQTMVAAAREAAQTMADDGYRVLALAEREVATLPDPPEGVERDLRLLGLVAITDPPRPEAQDAIATCRVAGMTPIMITGDHPRTARAIARRIGLLPDTATDAEGGGVVDGGAVLTGAELDDLDDEELARAAGTVRVYARIDPEQKLRIVNAWKDRGAVVAMTGDGVNDAPALRRADIGVAMGITGTDVSKEAADIVLADDNFETIVLAVEEGRRIYDNIRRFVRYLLTTNSGEIAVMLIAPLFGLPLPLIAIQILWINLVTDGLPALALGLEPAEPGAMHRPPRPPDEPVLGRGLWQSALAVGLLMAAVTVPLQAWSRSMGWPWQTMVFATLALLQLGNAIAVRSEYETVFRLSVRSNLWLYGAVATSGLATLATVYVPALRDVFETESLDAVQLATVLAVSSTAFVAVELQKWGQRRRGRPVSSGPAAATAPR